MDIKTKIIGLVLLVILTASCSNNSKPKGFDYGKVVENKYHNSFFGLEMDLPIDWVVQTKEQTENLAKMGKELVAGDDKNLKAIIDASEINSANLLVLFKHEVGAAVEFNPNFALVTENLKNLPGIKNGSDYLFQARKLLKQSQVQYDHIDEEFKKETINNHDFYIMNCSISYMGKTIKQKYYASIKNRFGLSAIISFADDEQKEELEKMLNSIKFDS